MADPSVDPAPEGTILIGELDHTGSVVDGFIFDQQNRNIYNEEE